MVRTLLTLDEAAERLGVHVTTLRSWVREERIPSYRLGRRFIRVDWESLLATLRHSSPPHDGSGRSRKAR